MKNLHESLLSHVARHARARNMARTAVSSRTMRNFWQGAVRQRRIETERRRTNFARRARALARLAPHPRRWPLWKASVYSALAALERHQGLNLRNFKTVVWNQPTPGGIQLGPRTLHYYNNNNRGRPRTIYLANNTTGQNYMAVWNTAARRYIVQ